MNIIHQYLLPFKTKREAQNDLGTPVYHRFIRLDIKKQKVSELHVEHNAIFCMRACIVFFTSPHLAR